MFRNLLKAECHSFVMPERTLQRLQPVVAMTAVLQLPALPML